MPDYFESGVFADNEPAWHGAGVVVEDTVLTKERVFELVPELGSEVVKAPIFAAYDTEQPEGVVALETSQWFANVRALDRKVLGVVGGRYRICQNRELFQFAEDIVDTGGALWKTAGTIKGGGVVWGLLELPDSIHVGGADEEIVVPFLMVTNSFDYTCAVTAVVCWTRVVCWNTWTMALRQAPRKFAMRHTESLEGRLRDAREALTVTYKQGDLLQELGDQLIAESFTDQAFEKFLAELMPYPKNIDDRPKLKANIDERREELLLTRNVAPNLQNVKGTKWGALNAVLEYEQHVAHPEWTPERRLQQIALDESSLGPKALKLLQAAS